MSKIPPLRFGKTQLKTGVNLHYVEQGRREAQPIVLLHGYSDSWVSFNEVIPALAGDCYVYAIDQRGHGDSERPATGYSIAELAADALAFIDAMHRPSAVLVGHSMGTLVAIEAALKSPARVAGLVLIGAAPHFRTESLFELENAVEALDSVVPADFARDFQVSTLHRPIANDRLDRLVGESLKMPVHVWRAALAGLLAVDYTAALRRITAPTLVVNAEHDAVLPPSVQDLLAAGLPNVSVCHYAGTGHAIHWERPEQVVRDVKDFLRSLPATGLEAAPGAGFEAVTRSRSALSALAR